MVPLSGVFYFLSAAAAFLYVNMVLARPSPLGRRRVERRALAAFARSARRCGRRPGERGTCWWPGAGKRLDISEEQLHTLAPESIALLKQIPADKPVYIQAYYSPEVPRDFVQVKSDLIGLLKEYAARGGDRIRLNLVETELYSDDARDAEKRFGIEPRRVLNNDQGSGRQTQEEIILGVAFSSGLEEVVIPFFDRGLPVEYELTRSIRVVSRSARKKVGILSTDAKLMGGFDMRSMGPESRVVDRDRTEEAIRRQLGKRRQRTPDRSRRLDRRAAVESDAETDRQPDRAT